MIRSNERGEGKIGCITSLLVLALGVAAGIKVLPVLYSNYSLAEYAGDLAGKAGLFKVEDLEKDLRDKARELEIPEAMPRGAMTMTASGNPNEGGVCTVRLHYSREVDFYGFYKLTLKTDERVTRKFIDAR
jgi:hypothetical protein